MERKVATHLRRRFLINPKFQLTFMGLIGLLALLSISSVYIANWYFFSRFRNYGTAMNLPPEHVFFSFIAQQESDMQKVFLVTSLEMIFLISTVGLVASHRIAGPIYRLTQHLKRAARTRVYQPILFRKGDVFPELADAYNEQLPVSSQVVMDRKNSVE